MTRPQHTPWRVVETAKDGCYLVDRFGQNLLYTVPARGANARLMAAAPELLGALRAVVQVYDKVGGPLAVDPAVDAARAVIARLDGVDAGGLR